MRAKLGKVPISTSHLRTFILSTAATPRPLFWCVCNIIYNKGSPDPLVPSNCVFICDLSNYAYNVKDAAKDKARRN